MAHVSPNDPSAVAESFVDFLPLRENATLKHQWFLTSEECL